MNSNQLDSLNFLQKTQNVTFYRSKRNKSRYESSDGHSGRKCSEDQKNIVKTRTAFVKSYEKNYRNEQGDASFREMKKKLREVLDGRAQDHFDEGISRRYSLT